MRRNHRGIALAAVLMTTTISTARAAGPSLLVMDRDGNSLTIVDPASKSVRARVPVGESPHEVAASADGKLAFVSNYGSQAPGNTISVVDIQTGKELRKADLGAFLKPHGLAVVEGKVYFTAEANRAIGRYDPETNKVDRIVGIGKEATHMIVASPNKWSLFLANIGSDSVSIVRRDTGRLVHTAVPGQPEGLDISPDGQEVWAGSRVKGQVVILDSGSYRTKQILQVPCSMAARLRFTPDGRRVLLPDPEGNKLVVIDAKSRKPEKLVDVGQAPVGVIVEPEGKLAYVALAGEGKVAIVDLNDLAVVGSIEIGRLSDGMGWAVAPAEAPSGR